MPRSTDPLSGVRLKLARAWHLHRVLSAEIDSYKNDKPVGLEVSFTPSTQSLVLTARLRREPPPVWSAQVGEVVHNFRSALDHVIYELAGRPRRETKNQFPAFLTPSGFDKRAVPQFLKGVAPEIVSYLRTTQPFATAEGEQAALWHLKELSDLDKHRAPRVVATQIVEYSLSYRVARPFTVLAEWKRPLGEIHDGATVARYSFAGAPEWPFDSSQSTAQMGIEVSFEHGCPSAGSWAVVGTLARIGNCVESTLRQLALLAFKEEL